MTVNKQTKTKRTTSWKRHFCCRAPNLPEPRVTEIKTKQWRANKTPTSHAWLKPWLPWVMRLHTSRSQCHKIRKMENSCPCAQIDRWNCANAPRTQRLLGRATEAENVPSVDIRESESFAMCVSQKKRDNLLHGKKFCVKVRGVARDTSCAAKWYRKSETSSKAVISIVQSSLLLSYKEHNE